MVKRWYGWHWHVPAGGDLVYASGFCFTFHQMCQVIRRFTWPDGIGSKPRVW